MSAYCSPYSRRARLAPDFFSKDPTHIRAQLAANFASDITEAGKHLTRALELHAKGMHTSVRDRIIDAQRCLGRAQGAVTPTSAIANPTGAMGSQTSAGQTSRSSRQEDMKRLIDKRKFYVDQAAAQRNSGDVS